MAEPSTPAQTTRIALIGAGFIARVHLGLLERMDRVKVVGICDANRERAEQLAAEHGIRRVFGSVGELLEVAKNEVDAVHLLVPPPLHFDLAKQCLEVGLHVLVEKPLTLGSEEALELGRVAESHAVQVGVNHNLVFDRNVVRLRRELGSGRLGKLEHLDLLHHVPLRQLETGDTTHFMFRGEANILLEQAVHPFSLVCDLLGPANRVTAHVRDPRQLAGGGRFFDTWMVAVECERGTAQVLLAFGRSMHEARVEALCSDAVVRIDLVRGTYQRSTKSRWLEVMDIALDGTRRGLGLVGQGMGRLVRYGLALFRLASPSEPFLQSMGTSLEAFHSALRRGKPVPNGAGAAAEVLRLCEETARAAGASLEELQPPEIPAPGPARPEEVLVTGGAGFLGRHVVLRLLDQGRPVTVLVRRPEQVAADWLQQGVRVFVGDATDASALAQAAEGAQVFLHMATCPGAMARSVTLAVAACQGGPTRLVHVSSTAALYLGGGERLVGDVDPDPQPEDRAGYAREKIAAENELQQHQGEGLEIVCLRPGIVVGAGGVPEHSGVGIWTRDNHCVGWGSGSMPLPLVLVEDCADAIVRGVSAPAAVVAGKRYNIAGDVRPTAREYVAALGVAMGRPYRFHPQATWWLWAVEWTKYLIKRLARRPSERPTLRDFRSRAFLSTLDTADVKKDLGWQPATDKEQFWRQAFMGAAAPEVSEPETVRT